MFLGMQDFDFSQSDSILPNKICWRMWLYPQLLRHWSNQ